MKWERVRTGVQCMFGCQIEHAAWALFTRHGAAVCEACAQQHYKLMPPQESRLTWGYRR